MTIRLLQPNIFDRFLRVIGKKRGVIFPIEPYKKYGPYVSVKAYKESFLKALFRSHSEDLPEGFVDIFSSDIFRDN